MGFNLAFKGWKTPRLLTYLWGKANGLTINTRVHLVLKFMKPWSCTPITQPEFVIGLGAYAVIGFGVYAVP